jgi:hypothetical protein
MNNLNSNAGLRIGRWFTPVFGLAAEGNVYFNDHCKHYMPQSKTLARYMNVGLIGTVNLSNWFAGYKGEPRLFEVVHPALASSLYLSTAVDADVEVVKCLALSNCLSIY